MDAAIGRENFDYDHIGSMGVLVKRDGEGRL